jgi:hypothetical protein
MRHGVAWAAALSMLFGAASLRAQYPLAAKFDLTKPLTLTGTVTQVDWANPYVHVLMKVAGDPLPTYGRSRSTVQSSSPTTDGARPR